MVCSDQTLQQPPLPKRARRTIETALVEMDDALDSDLPPGHLEVGQLLGGRYRVGPLIGQGGFARVYRGHDPEIGRDVAIKLLNVNTGLSRTQHEAVVERFRREARIAARIKHRCVVNIYDIGVTGEFEQPYIIMELLDGCPLDEWLEKEGALAPERILPLFVEALEALGEGHELGVVHKDLKPSNLFLSEPNTRREYIRILDFGIARVDGSDDAKLTATGQVTGTPQYMAPEYIATQTVTPALDVYQMGLLLVEVLTGRAVVDDDSMPQCILIHSTNRLVISLSILTGPLGNIIRRSVSFEPANRFRDATEFADALRQVDPNVVTIDAGEMESPSIRASSSPGTRSQTSVRDNRGLILALVAAVVMLLGAVIAVGFLVQDSVETPTTKIPTSLGSTAEVDAINHKEDPPPLAEAAPVPPVIDNGTDSPAADTGSTPAEIIQVDVQVTSPRGARIFRAGAVVGQGSAAVKFLPSDKEPVKLEVKRRGYKTRIVTVKPSDGPVLKVRLQAIKAVVMP